MRVTKPFSVLLLAAAAAAAAPNGPGGPAVVRRELDARASDDRFSGVVLIAQGGRVVLHEARGFADAERRVPVTLDTSFNLGSANKMFTAVAIAQLAQAGKLAYTDTIGRHLPDYPNRDAAARVTIHHLLTHTGGLGNFFGPGYEERRDRLERPADYLALVAAAPLAFEPGARWEYSNGGFAALGAIVEKASGLSYTDYVQRHILEPSGMTRTGFYAKTELPAYVAIGLTRSGRMLAPPAAGGHAPPASAPRRPNTDRLPARGSSAGGGYATASDLLRFATALLDNRLLDRASTEVLLSGKAETPRGKYAYGFSERMVDGKRVVGHNGGFPGVNAELLVRPETRDVVVVLSNYDPPAASQLAEVALVSLP